MNLLFKREIPVRKNVDVLVVGGGPAGVAASVSAARNGASVYLVEAHSCLGGMGTAGLVPWWCGLSDGQNFLAGGIGAEVLGLMEKELGTDRAIHAETLKRIYDKIVEESGVRFTFHTALIGIEKEGENISCAVCSSKSGIFAIKAKVFIDCTGDGDLSAMAGAEFEKGDEYGRMMPTTLCSLWCNVEWENREKNHELNLDKAFEDGVFTIKDRHIPGMASPGHGLAGANIGHIFGVDATDDESLTKALIQGRRIIPEFERYYRNYVKGYENMTLAASGSLLGVRETRRITGDYVLCLDDYKKQAVFDDEIGRFSYPVDIHSSSPDKDSYDKFLFEFKNFNYKNHGENYGIPYRSLIPKGLNNALVAGRCISTDRYMQGSIRVMPGCFITGQAVGMAASMAAGAAIPVRKIDVKKFQSNLKKIGAFLPNCK